MQERGAGVRNKDMARKATRKVACKRGSMVGDMETGLYTNHVRGGDRVGVDLFVV